jgi:hypothetical protein
MIFNANGTMEIASGDTVIISNESIDLKELNRRLGGLNIVGIGSISDSREATVIEGTIKKNGKKDKFRVENLKTSDNIFGDPKDYLTCGFVEKSAEILVRKAGKIKGQVLGFAIERL